MALARQFEGDGGCAHYVILTYFHYWPPIWLSPRGIWGVRTFILTPQHVLRFPRTDYLALEGRIIYLPPSRVPTVFAAHTARVASISAAASETYGTWPAPEPINPRPASLM